LTKDEHLGAEFATTWPTYELDDKTRALLAYAKKLTEEPGMIEDEDVPRPAESLPVPNPPQGGILHGFR
jgi:hypothetical protein